MQDLRGRSRRKRHPGDGEVRSVLLQAQLLGDRWAWRRGRGHCRRSAGCREPATPGVNPKIRLSQAGACGEAVDDPELAILSGAALIEGHPRSGQEVPADSEAEGAAMLMAHPGEEPCDTSGQLLEAQRLPGLKEELEVLDHVAHHGGEEGTAANDAAIARIEEIQTALATGENELGVVDVAEDEEYRDARGFGAAVRDGAAALAAGVDPAVTKLGAIGEGIGQLEFGGRVTAGRRAHGVKAAVQALPSPARATISERVRQALLAHPVLVAAARPDRLPPLCLSRYRVGQTYGPQLGHAIMRAFGRF